MAGSIFENAGNPYLTNFAPSLADAKADAILTKTDEKIARLNPAAAAQQKAAEFQSILSKYQNIESLAGNNRFQDLVDLSQASVVREAENVANFATGQSNPNLQSEADSAVGVSSAVRDRMNAASQAGISSLADARINFREGNYLQSLGDVAGAAGNVLPVLPELTVDSLAGSLTSGLAGSAATAGIGAIPIALNKLYKAGAAVDQIGDAVQAAVAAKDANKKLNVTQKALAYTAKSASQTSFMTASVLQQNEEDYIKHNGEPSSALHKIVNAPAAIALNILDKAIFMSFLPSRSGVKAAAKASKDYVKEVTTVLSDIPKKYSKQVAMRVLGASGKAAGVGGAEAVQEYLQTWHSILQAKMDDASITSALNQLRDDGNIDEANFSALVGAMVGGAAKVASQSPGVVVGTALDATLGTASTAARVGAKVVKKGAEVVSDSTTKAGFAVLSKDERAAIRETNEAAQKAGHKDVDSRQGEIDLVEGATTLADLQVNSNVAKRVEDIQKTLKLTDEKLGNEKIFASVKKKVISDLKAQQATIKATVYGSSKARVLKKVGVNAVDKGVAKAQSLLSKVDAEQVIASANKLAGKVSESSVKSIKGIKSSTARGVLNLVLTSGDKSINTAVKAASNLELGDLDKIIKVLKDKNPNLVGKFNKMYDKKLQAAKNLGSRNETLTTSKNIKDALRQFATGADITADEAPKVFIELSNVIGGKIGDLEALEVVEAVMKRYKDSAEFKAGTNKVSVSVLESKLADRAKVIRKPIRSTAKDKLVEAVDLPESAKVSDNKAPSEVQKKRDKLNLQLSDLEQQVVKGSDIDIIVDVMPMIAGKLKRAEYKTLEEALSALDNFDNLRKSDGILTALKKAFPEENTPEVMTEDFDNEPATAMNDADAKSKYNQQFPECAIK